VPFTLSGYVGRTFLAWVAVVFGILLAVVMLFDVIELLRRASNKDAATLGLIAQMAIYKAPNVALKLIPFAVLFGTMTAFWRLTRSQELIVARSAGVSIWQILAPALMLAAAIGVIATTLINPISATMLSGFEAIENRVLKGRNSVLAVSDGGVWLRQAEQNGHSVIHAQRVGQGDLTMLEVIIFLFEKQVDGDDQFVGRIDAERAYLQPGYWQIENGWITGPDREARRIETMQVPTDLTIGKIQDSFASPQSMSFWSLPGFIDALQASGFSAHRHRLQLHRLLADPLLLCAMVLVAAPFSLRMTRRGGAALLAGMGLFSGFLIYFMSDVVYALGLSGSIPAAIAAWTPAAVSSMLGIALLLHLEDG